MYYQKLNKHQEKAFKKCRQKTTHNKRHETKMAQLELRHYEHAKTATDAQMILNTQEAGILEPGHEMEKDGR